jgi:hypothetical protein
MMKRWAVAACLLPRILNGDNYSSLYAASPQCYQPMAFETAARPVQIHPESANTPGNTTDENDRKHRTSSTQDSV